TDHLGSAVARLYERYADLLPDSPSCTRAAATARSIAAMMAPTEDFDRYNAAIAPTVEFVDHRTVGIGSGRGAEAFREWDRSLLEVAENLAFRVDDILCLRSDALLIRWTNSGTLRAGGGAYERCLLMLWMYGPYGLLRRYEQFDANCDHEALARFDELATESPATPSRAAERPVRRRVRPNAATAHAARLDAAIAARDADTCAALQADDLKVMHHPTGVEYDREGVLVTYRSLLSARDPTHRFEPLATLGDTLALGRLSVSTSGGGDATAVLDFSSFGAIEIAYIALIEVDAHERSRRIELFAGDRLGDAVVRLYERYADILPDGSARDRAATTARSVAAYLGRLDIDRMISAVAPGIEYHDHRHVGFGAMRGIQEFGPVVHSLFEAVADVANRVDDVVDLRPDAGL